MMRLRVALLAVLVTWGVAACHGKTPPPKPPAPPVVPSAPPPAPRPAEPTVAPQPDEYARVKAMDVDSINRLGLLEDVHFDFDKDDLRESDRTVLAKNAESLKKFDFLQITVQGHCDERGTVEYNLALGERRSRAAQDYLVSLGVAGLRLKTVSLGKEAPVCQDHREACWAQNRRAHFVVTGKAGGH